MPPTPPTHPGEDRATFMQRIRTALGRDDTRSTAAPAEPPPDVDEALIRLAAASDDLPVLFTRGAEAVGMTVHRSSAEGAAQTVVARLREHNVRRVGLGAPAVEPALNLRAQLTDAGFELVDWRTPATPAASRPLDAQYDLDAGVTDVHAALAETGTLVCCADADHSRGLSLVPLHHVAIVRRSDILPDMLDYWQRYAGLAPHDRPASTVFITGPSKTADIEGELITGVHGPGSVDIILVDDM
ncbi:MAG: LUD domain-containing protein [Phycisphaeraceae bacterium]